jgi:ribonuclease BN (tRNA processing enzyme)
MKPVLRIPGAGSRRSVALAVIGFSAIVLVCDAPGSATQDAKTGGGRTKVILLGTGTPNADPERWGPGVAIVVDDEAYLVDAGVGIVRRAAAAAAKGVPALRANVLRRVFITHLHSDHTLGLPDLMLSPWVLERTTPLDVYGPEGIAAMSRHIEEAWREDIAMRLYGLEPQSSRNYRAVTHDIKAGRIFEDSRVRVDAIPVPHGSWPEAFGYRFHTPDRSIVISGDTRPSDAIAEACGGCDVLMHEVYSTAKLAGRKPEWQTYHRAVHTSTVELAALALKAKPKLLVLYHQLYWGATDDDLLREIREAGYQGAVVAGKDLGVY